MLVFALLVTFIALAVGLAWFLISRDKGSREPIMALWLAVGLGVFGGLVAATLENQFLPKSNFDVTATTQVLFYSAMAVGFIEEFCKFLPLAFVVYKKSYFNENTDGIIYFALAGLGFGVPENIMYTVMYGAKTGGLRLILTPFFHAATLALVGYFLIRLKLKKRNPILIVLPLLVVSFAHGFYDFAFLKDSDVLTVVGVIIALCFSISLFVLYVIARQKDQDAGLSVVGNNHFCRSCGKPNPKLTLYCVYCGKNA